MSAYGDQKILLSAYCHKLLHDHNSWEASSVESTMEICTIKTCVDTNAVWNLKDYDLKLGLEIKPTLSQFQILYITSILHEWLCRLGYSFNCEILMIWYYGLYMHSNTALCWIWFCCMLVHVQNSASAWPGQQYGRQTGIGAWRTYCIGDIFAYGHISQISNLNKITQHREAR